MGTLDRLKDCKVKLCNLTICNLTICNLKKILKSVPWCASVHINTFPLKTQTFAIWMHFRLPSTPMHSAYASKTQQFENVVEIKVI